MKQDRRNFIKTATATLALTAISGNIAGCRSSSFFGGDSIKEFGLQLYTLRDVLLKDPKGILKQVAGMGYKQIESYDNELGIFLGMKNTDFKKYMDELGMKMVSAHCNTGKDFERTANEAAEIGMKYLLESWLGPQKKIDDFKRAADKFNQLGAICKRAGLRFAYHNHDYSFYPLEGQIPQDVLMQHTDPALVDYQMDIYWVVTAGEDPVKWFEKYPNRFTLSHIKDRKKNVPLSDHDASCILGQGQIDFPKVLKAGQKKGLQYFIVEQERYDGTTPLLAVKANADYLKKIKL